MVTTENQMQGLKHSIPRFFRITLVILTLLVISSSGFLIFYAAFLHPKDLKVQATTVVSTILANQTQATVTNSPQFLYAQLTSKIPTINNFLDVPTVGWNIGKQNNSNCTFTSGAYHILANGSRGYFVCMDGSNQYSNFVFQIQMTILNGSNGGVVFRSTNQGLVGDRFSVTSSGIYSITQSVSSTAGRVFLFGRATNLHPGTKQPILITIIARGTHLSFYVNKQFISTTDDNDLSTGNIGLFATSPEPLVSTDVAFNNAQLWIL